MFLVINESEDRINLTSLPSANTKLEFTVLVPPSELRGVNVIWRVLQDCDKKNNDLTAPVIDLLTKLYHCLMDGFP